MSEGFLTVERPVAVTDVPTIKQTPGSRRIEGLWPLRRITGDYDGDGVEYVALSVSHYSSRRCYHATINREEHFTTSVRIKPFDAARVGDLIPVGRFSQKSLQAAFDAALRTLREEIAAGDRKLASYFVPSDREAL